MTFIDTSAFYALLDATDPNHKQATRLWDSLLNRAEPLCTSNYVVIESCALLQNRIGLEAVETFVNDLLPVTETYAIDAELHSQAIAALLAARRRKLSLVDCSSFLLLRSLGAKSAFAFDRHFREQGFPLPSA